MNGDGIALRGALWRTNCIEPRRDVNPGDLIDNCAEEPWLPGTSTAVIAGAAGDKLAGLMRVWRSATLGAPTVQLKP